METDRFRKRLSLLGVAVGIFSIVTALSLVHSLQQSVREGFADYGSDILFVDREPFEPDLNEDGVFRWWNYAGRPAISWQEYRYLSESFPQSAFLAYGPETVGVDGDWRLIVGQPLAQGRGLTPREIADGTARCLAGAESDAACGDIRWLDGARYEVVGVFEKAGMTMVSPVDIDHVFLVPYRSMKGPVLRSSIAVAGAEASAVRERMRTFRRLSPLDPDNFAINRMSFLRDELDEIFALVAKLGWIVGLFSLLAGGIGMANMLYVSVEERKAEIGLRRAVGARKRVIARQFRAEAAKVSLLGGSGGIALAEIAALSARLIIKEMPLSVPLSAALSGLAASLAVGLLFGAAPARAAAGLNPVDALKNEG